MLNKRKKVLVTGGCGFVGSHLVDYLVKLGFDVTVLDNLSSGTLKNLNNISSGECIFCRINLFTTLWRTTK